MMYDVNDLYEIAKKQKEGKIREVHSFIDDETGELFYLSPSPPIKLVWVPCEYPELTSQRLSFKFNA